MKLRSFFNRPATSALIAAIISLLAWGAMAWGLSEPGALVATEVTPRGIAIGAALLPALIMPVLTLNFLWAAQKVRAAKRGENVIGRWIVSATELAAFAANNAARNALGPVYHNEWKPPRKPPAEGIEIIFVPDGVVVGSAFYSLVTTGPFRFTGVQELSREPASSRVWHNNLCYQHYCRPQRFQRAALTGLAAGPGRARPRPGAFPTRRQSGGDRQSGLLPSAYSHRPDRCGGLCDLHRWGNLDCRTGAGERRPGNGDSCGGAGWVRRAGCRHGAGARPDFLEAAAAAIPGLEIVKRV